jgi:S-adenosylmethionine hydrolase
VIECSDAAETFARTIEHIIGARRLTGLESTFAEGPAGEPVLVVGSSGYIEVAVVSPQR